MKKLYSLFLLISIMLAGKFSSAQEQKQISPDNNSVIEKMKADGLPDAVIEKLLAQRKLWEQQGRKVNWTNLKKNPFAVSGAACSDMGVENGWGAWMWQNGTNSGVNPPVWSGAPASNPPSSPAGSGPYGSTPNCPAGGSTAYYEITSGSGIDCNTPGPNPSDTAVPVVCPGFGFQSIKIGDGCGIGSNCNQLTYQFKVTPQDTEFTYSYAVVLEDAGHQPNEQPFVNFAIYDSAGNTVSSYLYTGGPNIPGFSPVSGTGCAYAGLDQYKPWTLFGINLSPYIGQTLTAVITNADCVYGGHFGYAYMDFDCNGILASSRYCPGNSVKINARSEPFSKYVWENGDTTEYRFIANPVAGDTVTCVITPWAGYNFTVRYVLTPASADFTYTATNTIVNFINTMPDAASCFWDFGDGNTSAVCNPTHTYANPGTYSVCLTASTTNGCTNLTKCDVITVTSGAGINEQNLLAGITILPNPASDLLFMDVKNKTSPQGINAGIYNLVGTEMLRFSLLPQQEKYKLDISALPSGVYFIKLAMNNTEMTRKIIVSKEK